MNLPVIDREQILKTAGAIRFKQGLSDSQHSQIKHFQFELKFSKALIEGFDVSVHYHAKSIEGACSCSDSEGFDFCRHCVCLVLHANRIAQQLSSLSKGPDKSRILAYLLTLDKQILAKQCLELIEQDSKQLERFLLRASLGNEHTDYAGLKRQITQLTRHTKNLFSQRQVKHFFLRIDRFLEELFLSNYQNRPERMIKVIEYAFQRINLLLNNVDDASGQRRECVEKLQLMYRVLFSQLTGRPDTKAGRLHSLWLSDRYQLLGEDIRYYLDGQDDIYEKFIVQVRRIWQNQMPELEAWQIEKIARVLMADAIASGNLELEQQFRSCLAKVPYSRRSILACNKEQPL